MALLAALCAGAVPAQAADEDGIAVAIVYDTSGSMKERVQSEAGKYAPKFEIANRALVAVAERLQAFATNNAGGAPKKIHAALFKFGKNGAQVVLPLAPLDAGALISWATNFSKPEGGTPLGLSLQAAGDAVLKSGLTHKHVLIITDGKNTVGPDPAQVLPRLQRAAQQQETSVSAHFVAFDVDDKVFNGVKKLGATVVAAANEAQLNTQVEFILEKKILLEDEEAPKKP